MRLRILLFLLLALLGQVLQAAPSGRSEQVERLVDVSGDWGNTNGSVITIDPYVYSPKSKFWFTIRYTNGKSNRFEAEWQPGFRQQFCFQTREGSTTWGVVDPNTGSIGLSSPGKRDGVWFRVPAEPSPAFQRLARVQESPLPGLPAAQTLSSDQESLCRQLGPPHQFVLAYEGEKRTELWAWTAPPPADPLLADGFRPLKASFVDGRLRRLEEIPTTPARRTAKNALHPWDFSPTLTPARLEASWGKPDAAFRKKTPLLGDVDARNYRNRVLVMFCNGRFVGAQSPIIGGSQR